MTIRSALMSAVEDTEADGGTPTPISSTAASAAPSSFEELEAALCELVMSEKWSSVLSFVKQHREQLNRDNEVATDNDDDITLVLNAYCRKFVQDRPGNDGNKMVCFFKFKCQNF